MRVARPPQGGRRILNFGEVREVARNLRSYMDGQRKIPTENAYTDQIVLFCTTLLQIKYSFEIVHRNRNTCMFLALYFDSGHMNSIPDVIRKMN